MKIIPYLLTENGNFVSNCMLYEIRPLKYPQLNSDQSFH